MSINDAKKIILEAMGNDRTYDRYIKERLAGNFACKIVKILNEKNEQKKKKERENRKIWILLTIAIIDILWFVIKDFCK